MKKLLLMLVTLMAICGSVVSAQMTETYFPNHLGRIAEIATPGGVLPQYHTLVGYDSTYIIKQPSSLSTYKVFGFYPNTTRLNPDLGINGLNANNYFGSLSGSDCYEVRYGDSSNYWIGSSLALDKVPFSVYNVGPRSANNPATTGGEKLIISVTDQNSDARYTPGERVWVFGDFAEPVDSAYKDLSSYPSRPFSTSACLITHFRTGVDTISYSRTTFNIPADGILPPAGTVIRFVSRLADTTRPFIYFKWATNADTFQVQGPGLITLSFVPYSFETPSLSLENAPAGMTIQDTAIFWNMTDDQVGPDYYVTVVASNSFGTSKKTIRIRTAFCYGYNGTSEMESSASGNRIRFWLRNDGSIGYRGSSSQYGLEYPIGSNLSLLYAGGFYIGGKKQGYSGNPDTINTVNVEFQAESAPGRILNSGPLGELIRENYLSNSTFYILPQHALCWPSEAPHNGSGDALQLSLKDTWAVFNDLYPEKVSDEYSLSPMFGMEMQRMTFQFPEYPLNNAVLVRMKVINKSSSNYDSCYFGIWNDPDVGANVSDDQGYVDSALGLTVVYSDPNGGDFAKTAYGNLLLQGPMTEGGLSDTAVTLNIGTDGFYYNRLEQKKIIPIVSAVNYPNPSGEPTNNQGDLTRYWYMEGFDANGNPKPNGRFDLIHGNFNSDQRTILGSGPFTFAAGDTQEIWYAMIGGEGVSNLAAKDTVIRYAQLIRTMFHEDMNARTLGISDCQSGRPSVFTLYKNYPNPFNPTTSIRYQLNQPGKVILRIYNVLGQEVRTLVNKNQQAGKHEIQWDGRDNHGNMVSSGIYMYRLESGSQVKTMKLMFLK